MEGISCKLPLLPRISIFEHKTNSPPPPHRNFHKYVYTPQYPLEKKIVLARNCVKVKVNTPNT